MRGVLPLREGARDGLRGEVVPEAAQVLQLLRVRVRLRLHLQLLPLAVRRCSGRHGNDTDGVGGDVRPSRPAFLLA